MNQYFRRIFIQTIGCFLLAGCAGQNLLPKESGVNIRCSAVVVEYEQPAMHDDFGDGRWATYDCVLLELKSKGYAGKKIQICFDGKNSPVLFKKGQLISFNILQNDLRDAVSGKKKLFIGAITDLKFVR